MYSNRGDSFTVNAGAGGGRGGPGGGGGAAGGGRGGGATRATGRGTPDDPDSPKAVRRSIQAMSGRRRRRPRGRGSTRFRPTSSCGRRSTSHRRRSGRAWRVRFGDQNELLVSGLLDGGGDIAQRPAVVDVPVEKGHVVLFANNPIYRGETIGSYFLVFNTILNFDHLNAGRKLDAK